MKKLFSQFLSLTLAVVLCLPVVAQNPRTGQSQDKPLDSKRTGFAPTAVRFANLAAQDVTTWGALSGNATVTTGVTAPDGTTGAATLSITSPPEGYRRVYNSARTITEGDWIVAGVWVKGVTLANLDGTTGTLETFNVASLTLYEATEGYRIDDEATNTRAITPPDALTDTQWQWLTTAFKVTSAVPGSQGTIQFALNCDNRHSVSFYAPVLHHIPVNTITDAEAEGLLQNLYPVAKGASVGTVATLNSQTFQAPLKDAGGQVFNVKANGAIGNGINDDTAAIQEIIDAAESRSAGDGYYRTVHLPAGTFKVSGLTINGRVRLQGASDGETVIYSTSNAPIIDCSAGSFEMPAIENIRIRGDVSAGSGQIGLRLDDGTGTGGLRTLIRNVWIENCGGAGLKVERAFSSILEGIFATNCAGYPFDYDAANMPSNLFVSCYAGLLRDSAPAGFRIRAGEAVLKSCNGVNSLNPGSKWAIVGKKSGVDGDSTNSGAILDLQDCNLESWIDTGILMYHASLVNLRGNTTFVGQLLTTQLNGAINNSVTTITVDSTQYFSSAGTVAIDNEHITYTGKTSTTLTGCTRGAHGTSAASHSDNATVTFLKKPIEVEHINEGTDYFAHALQRGVIEDSVVFKDGGLSNYVRGAAIHANGLATFQTAGRGSRIVGDNPLQHYWNSVTSTATKLARADSYLSRLTIIGTTSLTQPTVRYIEVSHSGATTLTLPNPGLYQVGEYVTVKDVSSGGASVNNITLQANGGGTVNGSSFTMNVDRQAVVLVPDGSSDWRIVATYSPGGSGITGSGSANRLAVWNGTSSQTSVSGLEYDTGSSVLKSPARFWGANTSASAPTFGFTGDTGTGFYLSATGQMGYASSAANGGAGGNVLLLKGDRITLNGNRISWDASETIHDLTGSGSPEGAVTAGIGSIYRRSNGGSATTLYIKESGTGNTGWVAVGGSSGANTALSNLASVAINTTLVSDTNNTDDLGTSSIAWRDLYLAGTFNFLARSDPGSPTNNDFWRSSTRKQLSIRNSGQTENLSASMWKSSASVFFDTTTTETSIISDTGVGTKTLAADRLVAGSQVRIKASGLYGTKATSPGTFTIKLKNGATTMLTIAAFTLPTNVADQNWWIEATGALNATGSSGTINWTINFYYNDGAGDMKTRTYTVNSTTINTTTTNALDITGQFSVSDVANFWQTDVAIIEIL